MSLNIEAGIIPHPEEKGLYLTILEDRLNRVDSDLDVNGAKSVLLAAELAVRDGGSGLPEILLQIGSLMDVEPTHLEKMIPMIQTVKDVAEGKKEFPFVARACKEMGSMGVTLSTGFRVAAETLIGLVSDNPGKQSLSAQITLSKSPRRV